MEMSSNESHRNTIADSVEVMARAKSYIDSLPTQLQNEDYNIIANKIDEYLKKYCVHSIVTDSIYIDYDRSKDIRYFENCFQTF